MWYKKANDNPQKLDINNPQDITNDGYTIDIHGKISDIGKDSPPQIITEKSGKKIVLLHGNFDSSQNKMWFTLDNRESGDVDKFKEWLKNHALPENTPYLACHGGKITFDSNKGLLNSLVKNNLPLDVGMITNQEGQNQLIIKKSN